jgi:hypothetical protein
MSRRRTEERTERDQWGREKTELPDGSTIQRNPISGGGSIEQRTGPNGEAGTHITRSPIDGRTVTTNPDGTVKVETFGGQGFERRADGSIREFGPRAEDNVERPPNPLESVDRERQALSDLADRQITNPEERQRFRDNMQAFEERARRQGLPPEEVARTYDQMARLMDAPRASAMPEADRNLLAQNLMHHLADPTNID